MTRTPAYSPKFLRQRKFLLLFPFLVLPFLYLMAYSLGVGSGHSNATANSQSGGSPMGFNPELPKALFPREKRAHDKLDAYNKADADSAKRKQWLQQDPYHPKPADSFARYPTGTNPLPPQAPPEDPRADALLQRLNELRQSIRQPAPYPPQHAYQQQGGAYPDKLVLQQPDAYPIERLQHALPSLRTADSAEEDPQLQKLNSMLDKIIRIQHPEENASSGVADTLANNNAVVSVKGAGSTNTATGAANAIPAIVPETQTLVAGATIALRMTEAAAIGGIRIPKDQLVYGVVSISNDRMLINIHSIRSDQSIYATDLQVYDMDGLPGIHIPGTLNREVAKQSADQGIASVNLSTFDPSIGAQATNAGLQAAKTLFSRKVKLIRVSVRAGYQVLLHGSKSRSLSKTVFADSAISSLATVHPAVDSRAVTPPINPPLPAFFHRTASTEKLCLTLRGIYLQQNILWFSFLVYNDGPIDYAPETARWVVRDRRQWKRTAIQDLPLSPVYAAPPPVLPGYSNRTWWVGFQPFALAKDKQLVLEMGERSGARVLTMAIGHQEILRAKIIE